MHKHVYIEIPGYYYANIYYRFGRRFFILFALATRTVARLLVAFSPNFLVFAIARFLLSCVGYGSFLTVYILGNTIIQTPQPYLLNKYPNISSCICDILCIFIPGLEITSEKWRVVAGTMSFYFWDLGYAILAGLGFLCRSWRQLVLVGTVPLVPYMLHFW